MKKNRQKAFNSILRSQTWWNGFCLPCNNHTTFIFVIVWEKIWEHRRPKSILPWAPSAFIRILYIVMIFLSHSTYTILLELNFFVTMFAEILDLLTKHGVSSPLMLKSLPEALNSTLEPITQHESTAMEKLCHTRKITPTFQGTSRSASKWKLKRGFSPATLQKRLAMFILSTGTKILNPHTSHAEREQASISC